MPAYASDAVSGCLEACMIFCRLGDYEIAGFFGDDIMEIDVSRSMQVHCGYAELIMATAELFVIR